MFPCSSHHIRFSADNTHYLVINDVPSFCTGMRVSAFVKH